MGRPSSSQDLMEEIEEIEEVLDILASDENEFIFKPRVRNLALNRSMSFNVDYKNTAVEKLGLNLAVEKVGLNSAKNDETLNVYTEDDNFSKTSTESDEISDDNNNIFEDYSAPDFEIPRKPNNILNDNRFIWILLWIMNFKIQYNISEGAIEVLLKFIKLVLIVVSSIKFNNFPTSKYKMNKTLGLSDKFISFVSCPKCHKLYKEEEVINFKHNNQVSIMSCTHIEFPNLKIRKKKICSTNLSTQSKLLDKKIINRPELIFPYSPIRHQLDNMY
ncbi:transposase domain-containing protein [Gigaspora margarita]|uniref:Transposase domain-containing protein n=1 Tax=Gigaspora margarita TaxID=4874 RepID=A0A8H4B4E7_GIGMA|nr:transposase domain-containing protein [Gigaspora margarita]